MAKSEIIFVAIYYERPGVSDPSESEPLIENLGIFQSLDQGKAAGDRHYTHHHSGALDWQHTPHGAVADIRNAFYLVRELERVEH